MTEQSPRTVAEVVIWVNGIQRVLVERLDEFGRDLKEIKDSQRRLLTLIISAFIAPIIVGLVLALILKGTNLK